MKPEPRCASCRKKDCRSGKDCFGLADDSTESYKDHAIGTLHRAASAIEARHYCKAPRLEELIMFAREMGFKRLGLAFCIGLSSEAATVERILGREFEVVSVCCKVCGLDKRDFGLEQIDPCKEGEVMCNPAGQARALNEAGTELNIICGLCVGHDAVFSMSSRAPVTTLIAKDRVLAHNPAAAVYCRYVRKGFLPEE